MLKREVDILSRINNPYIVKMVEAARTKNKFYIFMEYCSDGNLADLIKKRGGKISESEAKIYYR